MLRAHRKLSQAAEILELRNDDFPTAAKCSARVTIHGRLPLCLLLAVICSSHRHTIECHRNFTPPSNERHSECQLIAVPVKSAVVSVLESCRRAIPEISACLE